MRRQELWWWAKKVFGVLFGLPSLAGALDLPAGYPTWYRCLRYGETYCDSIRASMPADLTDLLVRWDWTRVGYVCGLVLAIVLLVPWGRVWPSWGRGSLRIGFDQRPPHVFSSANQTFYRVAVHNPNSVPAENVTLALIDIRPRPKTQMFQSDFPYRVTRAVGRESLDLTPCRINPGEQEFFEIAQSWVTGPPDSRLIVNRIDTKSPKDGGSRDGAIMIERDEEWICHYRTSSANLGTVDFYMVMKPRGDTLSIFQRAEL